MRTAKTSECTSRTAACRSASHSLNDRAISPVAGRRKHQINTSAVLCVRCSAPAPAQAEPTPTTRASTSCPWRRLWAPSGRRRGTGRCGRPAGRCVWTDAESVPRRCVVPSSVIQRVLARDPSFHAWLIPSRDRRCSPAWRRIRGGFCHRRGRLRSSGSISFRTPPDGENVLWRSSRSDLSLRQRLSWGNWLADR